MASFDALFELAAPLVLARTHERDVVPQPGGRWSVSIWLTPPNDLGRRLAELADHARTLAGDGHFESGRMGSAHLTVRALEMFRDADRGEPFYRRCAAALHDAATETPPLRFRLTGLTLAPICVMATFEPLDDEADRFRGVRLGEALGADGAAEGQRPTRGIWDTSLPHFTRAIDHPAGLVDWVRAHRRIVPIEATSGTATLGRFRHRVEGPRQAFVPEPWDVARLLGPARA